MDKGYMLSEKEYLEVSRYGLPTTGWLGLHNIDVDLCEFWIEECIGTRV